MKEIFVTGATGFVGHHFRARIQSIQGWRMLEAPPDFDLRDSVNVARAIAALSAPPDAVLHLAAQSNVPLAFADPEATFNINFSGTLRLLRALKANGFCGRFLFVGTADAYGLVPDSELPVSEDRALRPLNPYAVSKTAAEALVYQWTQTEGLDAVMVRPFNHIGPGQDERFAVAAFARQIAEIAAHKHAPRVEVGDLEVTRDFTDVRDVVQAYIALIEHGKCGVAYNIGSGEETRLGDILSRLVAIAGIQAEIVVDSARLRPVEQRRMCGDTTRMWQATGWRRRYALDQTLADILSDWKEKIGHD